MKRLLGALILFAVVLALICLVNAVRLRPVPPGAPPASLDPVDASAVASHLSAAIRFRTVSHQDPKDDDHSQIEGLRHYLEETYPRLHAALKRELVNGDGLLFTWEGKDRSARPVLLMAHQDVVPVEPGTEGKWAHPPFEGAIADGLVWGRGALDDKGSLITILEAVESLVAEGFHPARTVYLASGFDEEVGGREGSARIAALLGTRGVRLEWVLDEGGLVAQGVIPGVARPVALISVTEKGYLTLQLTAHAEGGHSSMPPPQTAIGLLARAIDRLQGEQMPGRLTTTFRRSAVRLAPEMGLARKVAMANLWLTGPLMIRALEGKQESAPTVRTTTAPTVISAGVKENVLPSTAQAIVNFRILPGDSIDGVIAHVRRVVADDRVDIVKLERTISEPAPESSVDSPGYRLLERVASRFFPESLPVPWMVNGATDSRHFISIADDVYRFTPHTVVRSDLKRVHGTDERVAIGDLATMVRAYRAILREGAGPTP